MHPTRFRAYFRSTRSLIAGLTALAAVPASAPALMAQAATPPAAATTPAVAKAALVPAVKALPAARVRPIDIDSLRAPWPHFLAGHGASGGNP